MLICRLLLGTLNIFRKILGPQNKVTKLIQWYMYFYKQGVMRPNVENHCAHILQLKQSTHVITSDEEDRSLLGI